MDNNFKLDIYKQYRKELIEKILHNDLLLSTFIFITSILLLFLERGRGIGVMLFLPIMLEIVGLYFANIDLSNTLKIDAELVFTEREYKPDIHTWIAKICNLLSIVFLFINIFLFIHYL